MRIESIQDLERLQTSYLSKIDPTIARITICAGTGCRACGAEEVIQTFREEIERLAILGDAFGVAVQEAVGQGQVEVQAIVLGIGIEGFAEGLGRGFVLVVVERFQPLCGEVRSLEEQKQRQRGEHESIIAVSR